VKLRRVRFGALALLLAVLMAASALTGYALTRHARDDRPTPAAASLSPLPGVITSATADPEPSPTSSISSSPTAPVPAAAGLRSRLAPLVHAHDLGGRVLASVVDAYTGRQLYSLDASAPAAPASTAKILTAVAVLDSFKPTHRIKTTVVSGGTGAVVLVGAGDPTLTGAAKGKPGAYPDAARLSDLAAQLKRTGTGVTRIVVDDSLFQGPAVSPQWAPDDVPSSYASAITPVMADGGRASPAAVIRSATPDLAAGHELAVLLGKPSLPVVRGKAVQHARMLASVKSPPMSELVEQMLQNSDNVIAECLAREVAIAKGARASFTGAAAAVRAVVTSLGVDPGGGMQDGSGLAASDRLSPKSLAEVFALITSPQQPELHEIVSSVPVAGWSGTLSGRFLAGPAAAGAGVVRAKTGTLTSVSSLAGIVHDESGRTLAFALIADEVAPGLGPTTAAESALDDIAAGLATCGCS
jgi:D-alanyl-D-alanine carboxypeptidase/D-alanyl-D-alanine-endopeptidase (penicillin-binding protein 4)